MESLLTSASVLGPCCLCHERSSLGYSPAVIQLDAEIGCRVLQSSYHTICKQGCCCPPERHLRWARISFAPPTLLACLVLFLAGVTITISTPLLHINLKKKMRYQIPPSPASQDPPEATNPTVSSLNTAPHCCHAPCRAPATPAGHIALAEAGWQMNTSPTYVLCTET